MKKVEGTVTRQRHPDDDPLEGRDLTKLMKGGVRGKYYAAYTSEPSNVVLIEPDLFKIFPSAESVNQALRILVTAGRTATKRRKVS
jgi:hypothetical protein